MSVLLSTSSSFARGLVVLDTMLTTIPESSFAESAGARGNGLTPAPGWNPDVPATRPKRDLCYGLWLKPGSSMAVDAIPDTVAARRRFYDLELRVPFRRRSTQRDTDALLVASYIAITNRLLDASQWTLPIVELGIGGGPEILAGTKIVDGDAVDLVIDIAAVFTELE